MSGASLSEMFNAAREHGRPVFMPFMTAGIPSEDGSLAVFERLAADGADAFELGIPYSDPLMDGEVIQAASSRALAGGMTFLGGLDLAGRVATATGKPVIVMTYVNPILQAGAEVFAAEAAALGISGVIIADVPYEESMEIKAALDEHGIGLALFVAPTTDEARLRAIAEARPVVHLCGRRHGGHRPPRPNAAGTWRVWCAGSAPLRRSRSCSGSESPIPTRPPPPPASPTE